jgi:hypothetical protein
MNISGPIESITLAGRRFATDGEDAGNISLSGMTNEVKFNGDGSKRLVRGRVSGMIENLNVQITHERKDLEYLTNLRGQSDFFDVSLTLVDGTVYSGSMQLTGDIKEDTKEGTAAITLEGDLEMQ